MLERTLSAPDTPYSESSTDSFDASERDHDVQLDHSIAKPCSRQLISFPSSAARAVHLRLPGRPFLHTSHRSRHHHKSAPALLRPRHLLRHRLCIVTQDRAVDQRLLGVPSRIMPHPLSHPYGKVCTASIANEQAMGHGEGAARIGVCGAEAPDSSDHHLA